ncbi:MAG: hypothetical protein V4658_09940 [Bacteroidota bacterium]
MNRWFTAMAIILIAVLSSCQQIYWQRSKVRVRQPLRAPSIQVFVNNHRSPFFNETFNKDLKTICEKEFLRMGYCLNFKDTPDFTATVKIDMDSFSTKGYYVIGTGGPGFFWKHYRKDKVYAILFDYKISNTRNKKTKWEEKNDIYFFDNINRDSRRSINMVKYTIRYGK